MRSILAFGLFCVAAAAATTNPLNSDATPPNGGISSASMTLTLSKANCDCSAEAQERSCSSERSEAKKCACTQKAMRACSQRCSKPFDWSFLCRDQHHKREVAPAPVSEPEVQARSVIASNFGRQAGGFNDRNRPAAVACGGGRRLGCPRGQQCSVDPRSGAMGFCVGSPCFLAGGSGSAQLCPADNRSTYKQICVQRPREDGLDITDAPGSCADPNMKCGPRYGGCPNGWTCQTQPNGDGAPCRGEPGCDGLCMHFGNGQAWKRELRRT